ncbi:hypothetical protein HY637_00140 [Candidatus Woesearchaeota archaeon]|nr:hypothetical protein [Candidatus Woesearchaeota archaeon]
MLQTPESIGKTPRFNVYVFDRAFDSMRTGRRAPTQQEFGAYIAPVLAQQYDLAQKRTEKWMRR